MSKTNKHKIEELQANLDHTQYVLGVVIGVTIALSFSTFLLWVLK